MIIHGLKKWGVEISEPFGGHEKRFWTKKAAINYLGIYRDAELISITLFDRFSGDKYELKNTLKKAIWIYDNQIGMQVTPGPDTAKDGHLFDET